MGITASILSGVQTVGTFASQQMQASGIDKAAGFNASIAERQAQDATARGAFDAGQIATAGRQRIGAQRVAAAGSGVDVGTGSALDLQGDEAHFSALDRQTRLNNAAAEAWGYRTQSAIDQAAAGNQSAAVRQNSYTTLLNGAGRTYGIYSANKNTTPQTASSAQPAKKAADAPKAMPSYQRYG